MTITRFDTDTTETVHLRGEKLNETRTTKITNWMYDVGTRVVMISQDNSSFLIPVKVSLV